MAVLTKEEILARYKEGSIGVKPGLDTFQVQAHAIDLRLGFTFMIPKRFHITPQGREALPFIDFEKANAKHFDVIELEAGQHFDLLPNEHVLVSTFEEIKVPEDLMAVLYPRSSSNRRGLSLDLTGIIDSGYEGTLTLPIRNNSDTHTIRLYPGERMCQIVFEQLSQKTTPRLSRYHKKDIIEGMLAEKTAEADFIKNGSIKDLKKQHHVN